MPEEKWFDEEERDLMAAYHRGEFRPVADQETPRTAALEAARRFLRERKESVRTEAGQTR